MDRYFKKWITPVFSCNVIIIAAAGASLQLTRLCCFDEALQLKEKELIWKVCAGFWLSKME